MLGHRCPVEPAERDLHMFGYGLACYARLRGEPKPGWARYLDTNPRVYMKHGLAYLDRAAPGGGLPVDPSPG